MSVTRNDSAAAGGKKYAGLRGALEGLKPARPRTMIMRMVPDATMKTIFATRSRENPRSLCQGQEVVRYHNQNPDTKR